MDRSVYEAYRSPVHISVLVYPSGNLLWCYVFSIFLSGSAAQRGLWPPRPRGFRDHTRQPTVGKTPLDE
jgi:hypothetical protein